MNKLIHNTDLMSKDNNNTNLKTKNLRINITNNPKVLIIKVILQKLGNSLISNNMLRKKYLIKNMINNNLILTNDSNFS